MNYVVTWSADAEHDLEAIADYIAEHDSVERVQYVIDKIIDTVGSLTTPSDKGNFPKELEAFGNREYRQIFFKPYRLIFKRRTGVSPLCLSLMAGVMCRRYWRTGCLVEPLGIRSGSPIRAASGINSA